jgi:hypothetical protein
MKKQPEEQFMKPKPMSLDTTHPNTVLVVDEKEFSETRFKNPSERV